MIVATLCATDVVLDTNVLSHADNAGSAHQATALTVLAWVRDSSVAWVLDDQGKAAPDPKTSLLYSEYHNTLAPQGLALALFTFLLQAERVRFAARPGQDVQKKLQTLVPRNKCDRAVLGAAHGTVDQVLVTNDYDDFPSAIRGAVKKQLGVEVIDSDEAATQRGLT